MVLEFGKDYLYNFIFIIFPFFTVHFPFETRPLSRRSFKIKCFQVELRIVSSRQSVQYKTNQSYPDASTVLDETDEEYREEEYRLGPNMSSSYEFGISGHDQNLKPSFVSKKVSN